MKQQLSPKEIQEILQEVVEGITRRIPPCPMLKSTLYMSNKSLFCLQSEVSAPSPEDVMGTASFVDSDHGELRTASNADNTISNTDSTLDVGLGSFLSRPVTLDTFTWSTADPVSIKRRIRPWELFMDAPVTKNKLNNYAYLRAKLHVKVVINATPFQYGLMRVCYQPLLGTVSDKIRTNPTTPDPLRIPYSQMPGIYVEPQCNRAGEIECPFFYPKNWLDITSRLDVQNMGTLDYVIFAPLDVALTGGPTSLTVTTIGWLENVELMGPTSQLALQSDEYGNGCVSKPASAVAHVASYLTKVPIIGPFARATEIGANAISRVAAIFGFTNPPNINNVEPRYVMSAPQLATSEISVPYQKLALDPKSELTIDPTPFGLPNEDSLAINSLKKRESFFGSGFWTSADTVGAQIFNLRVSPHLRSSVPLINAGTVGYRVYTTPLSYMCNIFTQWRGTLKVRMKVVCSKYHKGRLKVVFDPRGNITTVEPNINSVYSKIIDIGETNDVTFEIPYHQDTAWLDVWKGTADNGWTTGSSNPHTPGFTNGTVAVYVYNTLEAPVSSTIFVLMYISAGDDFEFNNPSGAISTTGTLAPSFFNLQSASDWGTDEICFGTRAQPSDHTYDQNFGQSVLSLRKLMRRQQVMDIVPLPAGTGNAYNLYRKGISRIPYTPGFTTTAWPTQANKILAGGTANYAFNSMHVIPYVAGMFLGMRGGVNFTLTINSPVAVVDDVRIIRITDANAITSTNRLVTLATTIAGAATLSNRVANLNAIYNIRDGHAGVVSTSCSAAPTVQFTIPNNSRFNFSLVDPSNYTEGWPADGTDREGALVSITLANTGATDTAGYTTLTTYAGIGSDFTCLFFLCCPTLDVAVADPTPI